MVHAHKVSPYDVLTLAQAADRLGVSAQTLITWSLKKGFPICRVTERSSYVVWGSVVEWLNNLPASPYENLSRPEMDKIRKQRLRHPSTTPSKVRPRIRRREIVYLDENNNPIPHPLDQ